MSRNLAARGFTFACCVVLAWAEVASVAGAQDFVRRDGTSFVVGGEPFRFVGANAAVMHGPVARAHYLETLDAVAADGLRVVRIWAFGETAADAPPWQNDYAFRRGPAGYVETSFEHLDRVLVAARDRGLKVIVVLGNRWGDYGGAREHLRWCGVTLPDDDADGATLADYWSNVAGRTLYWEHVARVVGRTNTVSHVAYRDDPTIFAWELINESAANTTVAADALVAWTDATARFIRERDANHMIAAGHIGYRTSRQREVWARVQELLSIDYSDAHGYPEEDPRVDSRRALDRYVDDRLLVALSRAHKPFVWGEFGYRVTAPGPRAASMDDAFLRRSFDHGASGALLWIYAPPGVVRDGHGIEVGAETPAQRRVRALLARYGRRLATESRTEFSHEAAWVERAQPYSARMRRGGSVRSHPVWDRTEEGYVLSLDARAYRVAEFESLGEFDDGEVTQLWGAGDGRVVYELPSPERRVPIELAFDVLVSSELPGRGIGATEADTSTIRVSLDGVEVGQFVAPPDRGRGGVVHFAVTDAGLLARVFARPRRIHALQFSSEGSPGAGGLCLYVARATAEGSPPALRVEWRSR